MEKYKTYIYGMGNEYNRFMSVWFRYQDCLSVLGIVTTQLQPYSSMDGFPVITVDDMREDIDFIIIAVAAWKEIYQILMEKSGGGYSDKIILSSSFFVPGFDLKEFIKLKQNRVSILSNYCIGGYIYHELGLEILSPTINMYCLGEDYLEFIGHYEYYLNIDMQVFEKEEHVKNTLDVTEFLPKGILDSKVVWNFNHHKTAEEAVIQWNERRKKINWDNVVALMILADDEEAERFASIPLKRKLGIYHKQTDLKDILYVPEWKNPEIRFSHRGEWEKYVNLYMVNGFGYISPIDWIRFLNGRDDYLRRIYK